MNILVTGSCGFIGSHLVEKLVKQNHNVRAFTFYNSMNSYGWLNNVDKKLLKDMNIISGDVRDYDFLLQNTKKLDVIIHLAALIGIPYSYQAVRSYIDTNVVGTYNVLNAAKMNNVARTIITSTSEVYGTAQQVPIMESHPLNAQSPYAASKIAADQLALSFFKSYGLHVTIIRPFNTFGPRQSARAIIPTIVTQLLKKNVIRLGNLNPTRDFTYIDDTVDAFLKAAKAKNTSGEVINIGNSSEVSIKDILRTMKKDFGFKFNVLLDKKRIRSKESEVQRLFASNKKAKKVLKWFPKYNGQKGFKKSLEKTIDWFSNPKNLKNYNTNIYNI